jgi:hypothetical protein
MAKKRMTLNQADAARRRAVAMLVNFGDEAGAEDFDSMSPEEYADHKGIEIVNANPSTRTRGHRSPSHSKHRRLRTMAKSARVVELEDTIRDIYDNIQNSGTTRADMEQTQESISTLCTEALPELEDEDEDEDDDGDGDDEEEGE